MRKIMAVLPYRGVILRPPVKKVKPFKVISADKKTETTEIK
jgi:hypothetical protein